MLKTFLVWIMFFHISCTGLNLRTWPLTISPNTHPLPDYAEGNMVTKGGYLFHTESRIKQVGHGRTLRNGRGCVHSLFFLGAWGDSRIDTAKVDGGISKVGIMEQEVLAILGGIIYHRHCTILIGE